MVPQRAFTIHRNYSFHNRFFRLFKYLLCVCVCVCVFVCVCVLKGQCTLINTNTQRLLRISARFSHSASFPSAVPGRLMVRTKVHKYIETHIPANIVTKQNKLKKHKQLKKHIKTRSKQETTTSNYEAQTTKFFTQRKKGYFKTWSLKGSLGNQS